LKPDYAEAHSNLGVTLHELGRLDEAEASCRQAIALKPDYALAHNNLGGTLQELGRLNESKVSYTKAVALKPDFAEAYFNLSVILAINEDYDSALDIIAKGNDIEPNIQKFTLMLDILKSRQIHENNRVRINGIADSVLNMRLASNPLISHRKVEPELVANLYDISTRGLDETSDERFGNGKTTDWFLFENSRFIMECVKEDLINIIKKIVKSDVHVYDSFFNILGAGSGSAPHQHLNKLDRTEGLNLYKQKYALQYYLRVGDQDCSEPGLYKLYEPDEEILPSEGMIIVIPAERTHSAVYGGDKDRVMIGINFYAL
jgi:tetratricopeptide (TPR) repeat protein